MKPASCDACSVGALARCLEEPLCHLKEWFFSGSEDETRARRRARSPAGAGSVPLHRSGAGSPRSNPGLARCSMDSVELVPLVERSLVLPRNLLATGPSMPSSRGRRAASRRSRSVRAGWSGAWETRSALRERGREGGHHSGTKPGRRLVVFLRMPDLRDRERWHLQRQSQRHLRGCSPPHHRRAGDHPAWHPARFWRRRGKQIMPLPSRVHNYLPLTLARANDTVY
jgi:hypothetical protein